MKEITEMFGGLSYNTGRGRSDAPDGRLTGKEGDMAEGINRDSPEFKLAKNLCLLIISSEQRERDWLSGSPPLAAELDILEHVYQRIEREAK